MRTLEEMLATLRVDNPYYAQNVTMVREAHALGRSEGYVEGVEAAANWHLARCRERNALAAGHRARRYIGEAEREEREADRHARHANSIRALRTPDKEGTK